MLKNKIKSIARVLTLVMAINIIPVSNTKVYADNIESSSLTLPSTEKSIYGPYNGTTDKKHAVEPFDEENSLDDYEYNKDTVLIKLKNKKSLFGFTKKPSVKNSAIKSLEEIDLGITSSDISPYSEENVSNSGTWYKAKLVKNSDVATVLNELNEESNVLVAEPQYIRRLETSSIPDGSNDEGMKDQWYLDTIGVKEAWKHLESEGINPGGSSDVVVAVIDTGVDYKHPDLAANIWTNPMETPDNGIDDDGNGYVDDVYGACTIWGQTEGDPMDDNGHGTHVAGIIASQANNDIGGVGIAYNTKIMPIKAAQSSGILTSSDIARAVIYAAENGADVINMSYGGYGRSIIEEDALAMAYSTSVLVASAGNDGIANEQTPATPDGKPIYPGSYPWVLGVMASSQVPNKNGDWLAGFSNWDIKSENSLEYEVMAPGSKIYSTLPNQQYARWDGTSMSAPVVSAIAALVRSKYTDKESYSSRFIMGQLASTGVEKQGITYSNQKPPLDYKEVSAINALTKTPKPKVTYMEHYIFDKDSNGSTENSDGVVDSGEIVDLGMVIRNHWGKAEDVTVTIDTKSSAGIDDPFVEIINGSVNYGAIGNFGTDDNGFIYEDDVITGVNHPFTLKIKDNAPNDHLVKLNVTLTAKNGFDENDGTLYKEESTISFVIRKGTVLPNVIDKDMTLTKNNYWIIPNATVIEKGAKVTVEPGTQIQFWSSEPEDPYAEKPLAYLQVKGEFIAEGTTDEPIEMFASSMWPGFEVKIFTGNDLWFNQTHYSKGIGTAKLNYVKMNNPNINVDKINNCYFTQDLFGDFYKRYLDQGKVRTEEYCGPRVLSENINNSKFYKLGFRKYEGHKEGSLYTAGKLSGNLFDNCYYYFDDSMAEDNVFLNNYKLNKTQYGDREYWVSQGNNFGTAINKEYSLRTKESKKFNYTGSTYLLVESSLPVTYDEQFNKVQEFAQSLGGNIVTINNSKENTFLMDYLNYYNITNAIIGLNDADEDGEYSWISKEESSYENFNHNLKNEKYTLLNYDGNWSTVDSTYGTNIYLIEVPGDSIAESVTLNESKIELGEGSASFKLIPSIYPENTKNKEVQWKSSDESVATVDKDGNVSPIKKGSATITVTTVDAGHSATCEVIVKEVVPTTGIKLDKSDLYIRKAQSIKLNATILPTNSTDKRIEWTSTNEEVATVDESGNVVGKSLGKATIKAKALDGGFEATCEVNVTVPVTGINVDKELLRLTLNGEYVKLNASVEPSNASIKDIIWTSSDDEIVKVDNEGNVTPIKTGTVKINARTKDGGFSKDTIVTVWDKEYDFTPKKVVANSNNTAILNEDGSIWISGQNYKNTPSPLSFEQKAIDIAFKSDYSSGLYILDEDGFVWDSHNLTKISDLTNVTKIVTGNNHLLALKKDGTVWSLGDNTYGQLGDGTKVYRYEVIQIEDLNNIVDIDASEYHSAAVTSDGEVYTWGANYQGQLGTGDNLDRVKPYKVNNLEQINKIKLGKYASFAIDDNNQLYYSGGIGFESSSTFKYIDKNVVDVDSSESNILYVKNDGNLYVGGNNDYGNLGIGNTDWQSTYIENKNINDVKEIISGDSHNIVVKNDGTIFGMGQNNYGQLGNMTYENTSIPKQVLVGILPDEEMPTITSTNPSNNATKAELYQVITINFNETIRNSNNYGYIRLKDEDGNIVSIKNKKITGKTIIFEPVNELQYSTKYTVEIPSDAVVDMFGNSNESYTFEFRTKGEGILAKLFGKAKKETTDKEKIKTEKYLTVESDLTDAQIEQAKKDFFNSSDWTKIKNNAILNRWWDPNVDNWMRFTAQSGDNNTIIHMTDNYWGTTSKTLIEKALIHYNDFKSLAEIKYGPILESAPESAYPFVTNVHVTNSDGTKVDKVGAEKIKVHVKFNRDMNTSVQPKVTFGPDMPSTDYKVNSVDGGWTSEREWVGEFNITPMTGDGYQFFKIIDAQAKDNKWLVTGNDAERFRFEIITSGVESMNLQADGDGNKIKLTWNQDDFDTLAGYNVYRSESEDGEYVKINSTIIPSHIKSYTDTRVEPGKTYYYKFTVLQTDMTESEPSNIASAAAVDNILPTISHNPVTSGTIGMPLRVTANVTDNVKVDSVVLNYRQTGDSQYKTKEMTNIEGSRYSATIEGSYITSKGIEYYIEASDGVGKATSGTSQSPNKVVVADNPKITSLSPIEGPDTGGTKVTISGSNFKDGMKVKFNNVDATNVVVESPTRATLITPSNSAGVVDVKVVNPNGGSSTLYKGFKYIKEGVSLTVNNAQGKKGSYVEVPIDVNYIDGLTALDMEFNYDPSVLKFIGVRNGELTTDFAVSSYEEEQGKVNISMAGADEANGTGSLVYIKLQVLEETDKKNSSLTLSNVELNGGAIKENITNGQFNILKGNSVYGNVNYYYNGNPMNNVNVLLRGEDTQHDTLTNNYGSYTIKDVYNGNYTLSASKDDEVNGITSYDASLVLQASSKKISLSDYQTIAADVNSDGKVNAVDASLILAYSAGKTSLPFRGTADIWKFETYNKNINISEYDSYGNDLYGILVGDVSGNWGSSNDPSVQDSKADFNIGPVKTNNDGTYTMPVTVEMSNANLFGTDLVISYDSEIATPIKVEKNEEVSTFGMEVNTSTPGEIRISLAGATSFDSSGDFINLVFESKNKNALVASTTVKDANVNENNVESVVYNSKDVNKDKSVDILDLATMAVNYNSKKGSSNWKDLLDINRDGIVDLFDLVQVSRNID